VYDSVHVNIEIVELMSAWIWLGEVELKLMSVDEAASLLYKFQQNTRVFLADPSKECWHSHVFLA
jgi:hypothetical protein